MYILNLGQILLRYVNQLRTRHLVGNVRRAVLLRRCIFILIAVFLKKTFKKKTSAHYQNMKGLSRKLRTNMHGSFLTLLISR